MSATYITLRCLKCEKNFQRLSKNHKQNMKRGQTKIFCGMRCVCAFHLNRQIPCKCTKCGKDFYRTPGEIKKTISGRVFCTHSCSNSFNNTGDKHPNYKDGTQGSYRMHAIQEYGASCNICGYNIEKVLQVHHIDVDKKNNAIENLMVLCPTHHREYHVGVR